MSSYVYVKNPNGKTYVYENTTYWDKESKSCKHYRKSIGHLDPDTGEIVPNYKKGDKQMKTSSGVSADHCIVASTGIGKLLDKAVSDIKLDAPLKAVFPDDWERILTCAYYLVSEGGALAHVEKWQRAFSSPYEEKLTSQRISELITRITPSLQQNFFSMWAGLSRQDSYYAMDMTSVSSYSEFIEFVRWGYDRDDEDLPQINLLMLTGVESHMPIYYRIIPGSIKDVNTLQDSLANISFMEKASFHYVMDKGFYSRPNIDAFYAGHKKFIIGVPFTVGFACDAVEEFRDTIRSHHNFCTVFGDELYAATKPMTWDGHRFYVHIYYDSFKAALDEKKFDHTLYCCMQEILSGQRIKEHASYYEKFFFIRETPVRGIKAEYNEEAIAEHKRNRIGWFVLATNDIKDKVRALEVYRNKDSVEKCFDDLKNDLDMKRIRMHSAAAMEGRIFIQFISLLITARLKQVMNEAGWFKDYDLQEVLNEMKTVRTVSIQGTRKRYTTELTPFQKKIFGMYHLIA